MLAVAAGIRAVLRVAGRKEIDVVLERTPDGAHFTARWVR
jgi:hypothetical protein